jgi:solute carrier family 34 (sodium-dependent phosphate cotransporter)
MTHKPPAQAEVRNPNRRDTVVAIAQTLLYLLVFLAGVKGLGDGFKLIGEDLLDSFFRATGNPMVGLMVGILATTVVQSSSVTTSMVVALVAAPENPLPLLNAVPMVMGANIGTTVTNTFVSVAYVGRREEFRRAFAVATCHDFFNFMAVAVLLPLEIATGYLRHSAAWGAHAVMAVTPGVDFDSPLKGVLKWILKPLYIGAEAVFSTSTSAQGAVIAIFGVCFIFVALTQLVITLKSRLQSHLERAVEGTLAKSGLIGIVIGILVTAAVQSSSITTSLLVPLAAAGIVTLQQAFPVTLGANIGTTLTALLASVAVSGPNAEAGVAIALVHLSFNLTATVIVYPVPAIRRLPLAAAEALARLAGRSRTWAFVYLMVLFYGLPALLAFLSQS